MTLMTNALVYVTNHKHLLPEEIDNALVEHYGVAGTRHSFKVKGMFFVDYESDEVSMENLLHDLQSSGMSARVIGL